MNRFATLIRSLNLMSTTEAKIDELATYFASCGPSDGGWALHVLLGAKFKRLLSDSDIRVASIRMSGLPDWLWEECFSVSKDLSETASLICPTASGNSSLSLSECLETKLPAFESIRADARGEELVRLWNRMNPQERMLFNQLIRGRVGVRIGKDVVLQGLAQGIGVPLSVLSQRWASVSDFQPNQFEWLTSSNAMEGREGLPFSVSAGAEWVAGTAELGEVTNWHFEWHLNGIRAQIVSRGQGAWLWDVKREQVIGQFASTASLNGGSMSGTVIDGILVDLDSDNGPAPGCPRMFIAFDLLEWGGEDIRSQPLEDRRRKLLLLPSTVPFQTLTGKAVELSTFRVSSALNVESWEDVDKYLGMAREVPASGVIAKRLDAPYPDARPHNDWIIRRPPILTYKAVLMYAERGQGPGYVAYSFGVWEEDKLVLLAKVTSHELGAGIQELNAYIRDNTVERIGPIRTVPVEHVFEIKCLGVERAPRRKAGILLQSPSFSKWLREVDPRDADTLQSVKGRTPG